MKIAVAGLWHLGLVTAACLANGRHDVIGFDRDAEVVAALRQGRLPVHEPGLTELIAATTAAGNLRFSTEPSDLATAELLWITYDTPIAAGDRADVDAVLAEVRNIFPHIGRGALVLISSQLPVGSTRELERAYRAVYPGGTAMFAYSPENLRLGQAIESFIRPARVVVGVRADEARAPIASLLQPYTDQIEWMSIESAEMTKHALNAWLATSVGFINELAALCERVGADAAEVERGLKSDPRVGRRAYLRPGSAFAGGTLARDLAFLVDTGRKHDLPMYVSRAVRRANTIHRRWPERRLREIYPDLRGRGIALLGLTYKPGTDTLRGSSAVQFARWCHGQGARVTAWDPALAALPAELARIIALQPSLEETLRGASAALVTRELPELRSLGAEDLARWMAEPVVIDPGRHLERGLAGAPAVRYFAVGRPACN